jgi:Flp pilus assembly protein TadD
MTVGHRRGSRRTLLAALAMAVATSGPNALADGVDTSDLGATDLDYAAGRQAIDARRWDEAVARLRRAEVRHPGNADLQNYLGYAYRNLGDYEPAFRHYRQALAIDPRHRGAHEYIGEAYLQVGDLASAEVHLAALRGICLLGCEELDDLDKAIAAYRARGRSG